MKQTLVSSGCLIVVIVGGLGIHIIDALDGQVDFYPVIVVLQLFQRLGEDVAPLVKFDIR